MKNLPDTNTSFPIFKSYALNTPGKLKPVLNVKRTYGNLIETGKKTKRKSSEGPVFLEGLECP